MHKQHNIIAEIEKELTELKNKDVNLAQMEVEQLKGVIRRTKREENSYLNRSICISNLDQRS